MIQNAEINISSGDGHAAEARVGRFCAAAMIFVAALLAFTLSGCAPDASSTSNAPYAYVPDTVPDEYQVQVARELGCDDASVRNMVKNGMGVVDYAHVVPAADMLKTMESRYGVDFRADWVDVGAHWELGCTAVDGPHVGEKYCVEAYEQDDGTLSYYDDYYGAYRSKEYAAFTLSLISAAIDDVDIRSSVAVGAELTQMISQSIPLDEPFDSGRGDFYGQCTVVFFGMDGPSKTEGDRLMTRLVELFQSQGIRASFGLAYYPDCTTESEAIASLTTIEPAWQVLKAL